MSKKKIIGIDINEVLRSLWIQFDKYYIEEFGEEGAPEDDEEAHTLDFFNDYKWEDTTLKTQELREDAPEDINPSDYVVDKETGKSRADFLLFKEKEENYTAREMYNKFLYEDFCLDIFGLAPKTYMQADRDLDQFYRKYRDQFDFAIVSKENWFSIPATLFWLSKITPRIRNYYFYEENNEIWDRVDVLITADPELLGSKPEEKNVIKCARKFNEKNTSDIEVISLAELTDNEDFQKLINYKEEKEQKKIEQ